MKLETPKGMRDYGPEEKRIRDNIIGKLKSIFEIYGFNPLETPVMEKMEILSAKYAGGAEILKETYSLTDQGGRELGLRYDLTVPFARFVGMNKDLKMPFKRYQVGPVFRDGPVKSGRMRQFYQCDVDIVGSGSMKADAECVKLALAAFDALGIKVRIRLNNRKLLNAMAEEAGIPKEKFSDAILSLDKLEKFGEDSVLEELQSKGISPRAATRLIELALGGEKLEEAEGMEEIQEVLGIVDDERVTFTPSLARGLSYYTGTIFEAFSEDLDSSLAGGGRYDDMIGQMVGSGDYPAVGISFGIEPITVILSQRQESRRASAKVLVVGIGGAAADKEADQAAVTLRESGIATDKDLVGRGISKNLDYANSYSIPYVLLIGEKEMKEGNYTLKNMETGEEEKLEIGDIASRLSDQASQDL